jgi:transposase-like protein
MKIIQPNRIETTKPHISVEEIIRVALQQYYKNIHKLTNEYSIDIDEFNNLYQWMYGAYDENGPLVDFDLRRRSN